MKSKKSTLFRGLTALLCALLTFSIIATATANAYSKIINSFFNLKVGEMVPIDSGEQVDSAYYKSRYGELTVENLAKLKADGEKFVEEEMVEGAVLLHNKGGALPLASGERKVTMFGLSSAKPYYKNKSAGGNNDPTREVSLYSALKEKGFAVNETLYNAYLVPQEGDEGGSSCGGTASPAIDRPLSFYTDDLKSTFADYGDVALVVVGRMGGENQDIPVTDDDGISGLALHQNEADMLRMIKESGKFKKTILLLNSAYPLELNHLDEYDIDAVLWIGTPGLTGFRGVVDLLVGEASPSGRLVDTYATDSRSAPAVRNFGLFTFDNAEEMSLYVTDHAYNTTKYLVLSEGIYVGYKYYETRYEDCILGRGNASGKAGVFASKGGWNYAEEVAYPFGYGLSYTTFTQHLDSVTEHDGTFTVKVTVTNTGDLAGKDVVEVYAQTPYTDYDRQNLVEKSAIQLAGFGKTGLLQPGKSETVTVTIDKYLIASYDYKNAKGYILDAGDYYLAIGSDAHDALNNVLAAKGATGLYDQFGASVTGDAAKTFKWTESRLDTETYRRTEAGTEVRNLFDNADINYWLPGAVTYMTRQDWNTYPQPVRGLNATRAMMTEVDGYTYSKPADAPSYKSMTQGVDNGIKLVNMHGVPYDDPLWEDFLDQLTLDEMLSTVCGSWSQNPVEKVMKPQNKNQDGPGGVSGPYLPDILGATATATDMGGGTESGTAYVGEAVAAATWSTEMLARRGDFIAEDCLFSDVMQIWCPGGNTHRTPFSGRNYEYFSEDGTLAYLLAAAESKAMQAKGVVAAIKHLALNEMEDDRQGVSTFLTEQAFREI
ncbi:MAG: glycoside hydrolase family 3 protein, partial [Oscillospiraceae bacterium]|nr:glycoside hydrolase family 3 protein [Oscillospiraceae bacterium]